MVISETQSAHVTLDALGRPSQLTQGGSVVGSITYDEAGRLSHITTKAGTRSFHYSDNVSKRPMGASTSKNGAVLQWAPPKGISPDTLLDTIAVINEAPKQELKLISGVVEATMLNMLSPTMRQLYGSWQKPKTLSDLDVLLCETPMSCFACLAFCNRMGASRRSDCTIYQNVPGQEDLYIGCMADAAQLEIGCGLFCL